MYEEVIINGHQCECPWREHRTSLLRHKEGVHEHAAQKETDRHTHPQLNALCLNEPVLTQFLVGIGTIRNPVPMRSLRTKTSSYELVRSPLSALANNNNSSPVIVVRL